MFFIEFKMENERQNIIESIQKLIELNGRRDVSLNNCLRLCVRFVLFILRKISQFFFFKFIF